VLRDFAQRLVVDGGLSYEAALQQIALGTSDKRMSTLGGLMPARFAA
jgi:hypothetical protein